MNNNNRWSNAIDSHYAYRTPEQSALLERLYRASQSRNDPDVGLILTEIAAELQFSGSIPSPSLARLIARLGGAVWAGEPPVLLVCSAGGALVRYWAEGHENLPGFARARRIKRV